MRLSALLLLICSLTAYAGDQNRSASQTESRNRSARLPILDNLWYSTDTGYACVHQDIRSTGTTIDTSKYFLPSGSPGSAGRKDDGTAGPFDIGGNFVSFGDTFRYAWVGINGAIALTRLASDTSDLNVGGYYTPAWDFPYAPVRHGRSDVEGQYGMPQMLIAPMWSDHFISLNSPPSQHGRIIYGNNGNPCQFIVEWDSMGEISNNVPVYDRVTFRVILNRCDGSIEFQYDDIGDYGTANKSLVGMQYDTSGYDGKIDPYVFFNKQASPPETTPRNGMCVRFIPGFNYVSNSGWNLISPPCIPFDANLAVSALYPLALTPAYTFAGGYSPRDTLAPGVGYWLKLDCSLGCLVPCDSLFRSLDIPVVDNWNLIGTLGAALPAASIVAVGTTIASQFFGYDNGYFTESYLQPGRAYWVKTTGAGTLQLRAPSAPGKAQAYDERADLSRISSLTLSDNEGNHQTLLIARAEDNVGDSDFYELPPPPPSVLFDARFASGRMLEVAKDRSESLHKIILSSARYPVTFSWHTKFVASTASLIVDGKEITLTGNDVSLTAPASSIVFRTSSNHDHLPLSFDLKQNYPNPFNPTTELQFEIPVSSFATLKVYDVLGQEVATLLATELPAGRYTNSWDASTHPSGVYFYKLVADRYQQTRKMLLLR